MFFEGAFNVLSAYLNFVVESSINYNFPILALSPSRYLMFDFNSTDEMDFFPWDENFDTGIPEIDEQHKVLVQHLNRLANCISHDISMVNQVIDDLINYALHHFRTEEEIWKSYFGSDESLMSHQVVHSSFVPELLRLKEYGEVTKFEEVTDRLIKFIVHWLFFHIIKDDKKFSIIVNLMKSGLSLDEAKESSNSNLSGSTQLMFETVMMMYDRLSSQALMLVNENKARLEVEAGLREANQLLEELAITDQLTGLYNRRYFDKTLALEIQRSQRDNNNLILVLFDIDNFKKLNDVYGHSAGDEALKKVGRKVSELCRRPSDFSFRIGGEEFSIIITGKENETGEEYGEAIRKGIESLCIPNEGAETSDFMTISVGVLVLKPHDSYDVASAMKVVDRRLYSAKNKGRNLVMAFDESS
ncbi:MAG: bacteriohemerythrin [Marinomonas atlantica]|nr:bacteriohemerythrin [Marinomonas atlantica]